MKTATVVLTIDNRTNRVLRSISSAGAPKFRRGALARTAIYRLLHNGYVEASSFEGKFYTVLGFVEETETGIEE
ncbi:hypothetical protein Alches_27430 [Alicyclobacillus hesperidum subsp. aegles]|uniref:hypothetical protein n=1 Tax=Alicyclobacillus hesperidum TaxID=89784 RepID=UPI002228B2ED|nr:hypothetical protein [Alicyclobacillus hesperidum]GLG02702.1 hypothetical protein Alches_27430 [Alicyclobacillus hesperidum subsp. aegles]